MTDVWIVLVEDRHADVEARPFSTEERAVAYARDRAWPMTLPDGVGPDDVMYVPGEQELNERMIKDGVVLFLIYSIEGDSVSVLKRTMDDTRRLR